jgi:integrase
MLRTFIIQTRKKVKPGTVKLVVALLSSLYSDLIESEHAVINPCRGLAKKTRALLRSDHDPKNTPYLHEMADVIRVYQALHKKSPTVGVAYAIGALAGLRTGEVRALDWSSVDLKSGTIHVQVQAGAEGAQTLKDGESRVVPIQPSLAPVLASWRKIEGGEGLVVKPLRQGGRRFLDDHTMGKFLRDVVKELQLEMKCSCCETAAAWYEYTRHGYACHFIMAGGSIEELSRTMGHSTTAITEKHYVHLRPGYYTISARNRLTADFGSDSVQTATEMATDRVPVKAKKIAKTS